MQFDYVIIGAGSAGALMANRLSENPRCRVLLVEAGQRDRYPWIHIPVGYLYCIGNPRTDWCYRTESEEGLNGRDLLYPRGKVLGGCSSINGMLYMRGHARDYESWAEYTRDSEWSWSRVLPDFLRHEDHHSQRGSADHPAPGAASAFHRGQGEWSVEKQRLSWKILDAFAKAATEAGVPSTEDFNRGDNEGVGYFEVNQRAGWRWNTSKAFLSPARGRSNLVIWTSAVARSLRLVRDAQRGVVCTGVTVLRAGQMVEVEVREEVVLSAGAVGTPHLLQLSGIGSADLLKEHNIPIVRDLPGVGANLQDHLQVRSVFKVSSGKTLNTMAGSWWGKAKMALEYATFRSGPMSMAPSQLCAITRSDPDRQYPNIQFHVQPLSLPKFGDRLHEFPAITASVCNLNPSSRGTVRLRSKDPEVHPRIAPQYLSTADDCKVAADSLRVARRIMSQPAMRPFGPVEFLPGPQHASDESLAKVAGDIGTTIFHPVGTARMGQETDAQAVVDSRLRLHGVRGLRVVDASVMPTITSGNTNSPTLMIAEKAARWILADRRAT